MSSARTAFHDRLVALFAGGQAVPQPGSNFHRLEHAGPAPEQEQTTRSFSDKWERYSRSSDQEQLFAMQRRWYLDLYGFGTEQALADFLRGRPVVLDAGCGLGYKAAWFARLAPGTLVVGVDYSTAAELAAERYADLPNLFFLQGDIGRVPFRSGSIDYVSCDQVIMHTQDPDATFAELTRVTRADGGQFACYFYAKKALPRELLDDHFRRHCGTMPADELWEMAEQLTELGRRLSELQLEVEIPAIPALGIQGGRQDLQRFIYWNFLKCFWNEELGRETSVVTNYDWYSPSNARRFSEAEVMALVNGQGLAIEHFHREEACYSGRFRRGR